MIPRGPVLYVKHAALDNVNPNDLDGLREVWSSFSGAKQSISQGTRLEYLSWRLYSRGIMKRRNSQQQQQQTLDVPELEVPPALEMSSSSDSINAAAGGSNGTLSSRKLMTLFDRIVTIPATPVDVDKPVSPHSSGTEPNIVKVTPVTTPELEVVPPIPAQHPGASAAGIPVVCGFDRVSVSSRSSLSIAQSPLKQKSGALKSNLKTPNDPNGSSSMFFIESSSDSEAESEMTRSHSRSPRSPYDAIPVPVPTRPGLVRRKTVTFEEPASESVSESASATQFTDDNLENGDEEDDGDDDFEDYNSSDDQEQEDEKSLALRPSHPPRQSHQHDESDGSSHEWGDSDWDDLSEDDEPMFAGRDVPSKPTEHRSKLSSMFASSSYQPEQGTPDAVDEESEDDLADLVPSPASMPRSTPEVGSVPRLGRVESQSSLFDHAMRGQRNSISSGHGGHGGASSINGSGSEHEQILLGGHLRSHRPFRSTKSTEDLMERELSQSVRTNISQKRQYDLDALWKKQTASSSRRPTLARSTTLPEHSRFLHPPDEHDAEDATNYHARGW